MTRIQEPAAVHQPTRPARDVDSAILQAVHAIRYGSVEITIHDSAVVQIESKEKVRFVSPSSKSKC